MTDSSSAWIAALGVLTASALVLWIIVRRELRPWRQFLHGLVTALQGRGDARGVIHFERGGRACQLAFHTRKQGPTGFRLAVAADVPATMTLHRRSLAGDWLLDSAEAGAADTLRANAQVLAALQALLAAGAQTIAWSEAAQAVVVTGVSRKATAFDLALLDLIMALALASSSPRPRAIGKPWAGLAGFDADMPGPPVMILLGFALALLGAVTLPVVGVDAAYTPVSRSPLLLLGAVMALALTSLTASIAWRWIGRRQVGRGPFFMVLPVLALGFWMLAYGALVSINGRLDGALPTAIEATIEGKFQTASYSRKFGPSYTLRTREGLFDVSGRLYDDAKVGDKLRIATRPGHLNVAWRDDAADVQLVSGR